MGVAAYDFRFFFAFFLRFEQDFGKDTVYPYRVDEQLFKLPVTESF